MPDIVWKGNPSLFTSGVNTTLVEDAASPYYEFAEKIKCTRTYRGLHSLCVSSALVKGVLGTGAMAGFTVSKSTVTRGRGRVGELVIEWEGPGGNAGQQLTPDTCSLVPTELNPRLENHPMFVSLGRAERMKVRTCVDYPDDAKRDEVYATLSTLGKSLADKLTAGRDNYYLLGWVYTWTTYWWTLPGINAGGYIETPSGPLAGHLGTRLTWLRKGDEYDFDGSKHKLVRSWMGANNWDPDLYA